MIHQTWSDQQKSQVKNLPATIFPTRAVPKEPKTTDRQLTKRSCVALEYGWHAKEDEPGQPRLPIGVETEDLIDQFCPETQAARIGFLLDLIAGLMMFCLKELIDRFNLILKMKFEKRRVLEIEMQMVSSE
ncbi:hypothetical protein PPACK8108_LOCUS3019 [Phakopsora pachyrhizi]|uniref:Uncharacterized protein n=1 Tax=Phakopsora pachyrhizi TaxID=170000 RepID=A0AAV0AL97_PHAPC|nr:hypothetical protein PPACK8108_LOCUS3019 [Phakopsora pachyrhizi]